MMVTHVLNCHELLIWLWIKTLVTGWYLTISRYPNIAGSWDAYSTNGHQYALTLSFAQEFKGRKMDPLGIQHSYGKSPC